MPQINIVFNQPAGDTPLPKNTPLANQIAAIPSAKFWMQADPEWCAIDGTEIDSFVDRAGGTGTFDKRDGNDLSRATISAGAIGEFTAARFFGQDEVTDGGVDTYEATGVALTADAPYSYAAVFKVTDATSNGDAIVSRFTDSSIRSALIVTNTGLARLIHGSSQVEAAIIPDRWNAVIVSSDGTNLKMCLNGVDVAPVAAVGSTGTAGLIIGSLNGTSSSAFDGFISDVLVFSGDVLADAEEKALLLAYFETVYGL